MKTVINNDRFFRDPTQAKIAGVCSGLAKNLEINPWIIRGLTVGAFLFFPFAIALGYVLAILLLRYRY